MENFKNCKILTLIMSMIVASLVLCNEARKLLIEQSKIRINEYKNHAKGYGVILNMSNYFHLKS